MPVTIMKIVAYYRLSKPKKGKSKTETIRDSYGLEDQRREVHKFAADRGARIVAEFTEVESGTPNNPYRAELEKAIYMAKMHKATIVIGKQDRLARNIHVISDLIRANVKFIPVDRPDQSEFETNIRASVDMEEGRRISERTKRGLAIAREKGKLFGSSRPDAWKGMEHIRERGRKKATAASSQARHEGFLLTCESLMPIIQGMQEEGKSFEIIAAELTELGHRTLRGKPFHAMAVHRIIKGYNTILETPSVPRAFGRKRLVRKPR